MNEILKEFKTFRDQVYAKFAEYDEILRTLIGSNSEKIVSTFTDESAVKVTDLFPAVAGMEYVYGKYYIEGETVYICKRTGEAEGGTVVLQFLPSQLVGQYFEVVE